MTDNKILFVMKGATSLHNLWDENLDATSMSIVLNYMKNSNFIYYKTSLCVREILQDALKKAPSDITHILYINNDVVLHKIELSNIKDRPTILADDTMDKCKLCLVKVNDQTRTDLRYVNDYVIEPKILEGHIVTESSERLCKILLQLNIDFDKTIDFIASKCVRDLKPFLSTPPKIFIATPCFGAQVSCNYTKSLIQTIELLKRENIEMQIKFLPNQIVTRARNLLACEFLNSDCTHLFFIDADIEWNPIDVLKLIQHKKEICVGLYANKAYIHNENPDIFKRIQYSSTFYTDEYNKMSSDHLMEIKHGATGFMMIERKVFDTIKNKTEEFSYNGIPMRDYFPCKVVNNDYLTEDYAFCQFWREAGGKIWADLSICLNHEGWHSYSGNPLRTFTVNNQ